MLITNQDRRRQLNSFIDKDRPARDRFYELLDDNKSEKQVLKSMGNLNYKMTQIFMIPIFL